MDDEQKVIPAQRANKVKDVLDEVGKFLDRHPDIHLQSSKPHSNVWFARGFGDVEDRDMGFIVIKNGARAWVHFIHEFFDGLDRPQIYDLLRPLQSPNPTKNAIEFSDDLCDLFVLRDAVEGIVTSDPWSRAMHKAGEKPAKKYHAHVSIRGRLVAFDENMDDLIRGKHLTLIITNLIKHFPSDKRDLWRGIFQHIADGGDGAAPQQRSGRKLTQEQIVETIKALEEEPTQEQAAERLGIERQTLIHRIGVIEGQGIVIQRKRNKKRVEK